MDFRKQVSNWSQEVTNMEKFRVSEIFYSPQGEGRYTGQLSVWVRFFSCNLQCQGFSQKDPTDPSSYVLEYKDFDVSSVQKMTDLPVFKYGCDTSYSWAAKFKHLCPSLSAKDICDRLIDLIPYNSFYNPFSVNDIHLVFTGGEPLLPKGQKMIVEVLRELKTRDGGLVKGRKNYPLNVTIETNGTQELSEEFKTAIFKEFNDIHFFFSISPKLFNVSGETIDKTFVEKSVKSFICLGANSSGQLKFVVNNKTSSWDELEETIHKWRQTGIYFPIWIMPLGATIEQQESEDTVTVIEEAMRRGYNISSRVHVLTWGNRVGT